MVADREESEGLEPPAEGAPWVPPVMSLWVQRFFGSSRVGTLDGDLAGNYLMLLAREHQFGGRGLPADPHELARLLSIDMKRLRRRLPSLLQFFTRVGDRLFNRHVEEQLKEAQEYRRKCSEAGKKGMASRWGVNKVATKAGVASQLPPSPSSSSSSDAHLALDASSSSSPELCRQPPGRHPEIATPADLQGLQLYATDKGLCGRWPELLTAWKIAFPGVDILAEVRAAHAWEVANPKQRKVNRSRFLQTWLSKAQDKPTGDRARAPGLSRRSSWAEEGTFDDPKYQ